MNKFTRIALGLGLAAVIAPAAASAGPVIPDPSVLQPPPPPGAVCRDNGTYTICHTTLDFTYASNPIFDIPCGTLYETGTDFRDGIRWYVDDQLVQRRAVAKLRETWSLSPTNSGPTVTVVGNWNWWIRLMVPGDESTGELTSHGTDLLIQGPRLGGLFHDAGITYPDGTHHGVVPQFDSPEAVDALCSALGG